MIKAYILSVDAVDGMRYNHAVNEAVLLGCPWQFVMGVRTDDPIISQYYSKIRNFLLYRRGLSAGEISVYLGHRRIWETFLDDGADYALVLEDDFLIINEGALKQAIADAVAHPQHWDVVKFFDLNRKRSIAAMDLGSTRFVCRKYPPYGAVAYLIKPSAARALLERKHIFRPVDDDIGHPWEFSLRVWSTERNLVTENAKNVGGSLLEENRQKAHIQGKQQIARHVMKNIHKIIRLFNVRQYNSAIRKELSSMRPEGRHAGAGNAGINDGGRP